MHHSDVIVIIDFGSQYSQLIARQIRALGVYCEIFPYTIDAELIKQRSPRGIILSGGPDSVARVNYPRASLDIFSLGCPILGICYGMQYMAKEHGGEVVSGEEREFGLAHITISPAKHWLATITAKRNVWMSHHDHVSVLPTGFEAIARSSTGVIAAMAHETKPWYGLQFHPEVNETEDGSEFFARFIHEVCGVKATWSSTYIIEKSIKNIREAVGKDEVILGLSGGVDSLVAAALIARAIGSQLKCIFVDHGFLRHDDKNHVVRCAQKIGAHLEIIEAQERFFCAVQHIAEPEEKRLIIGREFVEVFHHGAAQNKNAVWLAQGTIYSDVIESAGVGTAHVIKSHHNVGGLPKNLPFKLLEPLRQLFKDEVRSLGIELGLPREMIVRHPFPGPGLAIRVLGAVTPKCVALLRQADKIFIELLRHHELYEQVSQAFAVFLPVNSVGIMGDERKYEPVIALRAVVSNDFMTARYAKLPHEFLEMAANTIVSQVPGISRVVYDICGKPPATIEWE